MRTPAPVLEGRTVLAVATTVLAWAWAWAWASAFVAIRGVGEDLAPRALALGRLLIGATVLGAWCRRRWRSARGPTRCPGWMPGASG